YPSSVLMNIVPAKVAGVQRIVMVVPTPGGVLNPLVMLAAEIAGADEVLRIGGAQAVAALAYGTQSIAPVDKITGPGNADLAAAAPIVDRIAAEHVELALETGPAEALAGRIRHAGAIFIGRHTPEAIGDYVAGTNHVLPTSRAARFSGGLGVSDFLKRTSLVACTPESLAALAPAALALAEAEGLGAHGRSVSIRLNRRG